MSIGSMQIGDQIRINHPNYKRKKDIYVITYINMISKTVTVRGNEDVNEIYKFKVPFRLLDFNIFNS